MLSNQKPSSGLGITGFRVPKIWIAVLEVHIDKDYSL